MDLPYDKLREHDIPSRGAPFSEIAKFAGAFFAWYPTGSQLVATWKSTGKWEVTLKELLGQLYFDVRRIHHSCDNDPDHDELEHLYGLLDAIRSSVKAGASDSSVSSREHR